MAKYYFGFLCVLFGLISSCNSAKKDLGRDSSMVIQSYTPDINKGKQLYATCIACHGELAQGNIAFNAPILVNQESWYLTRQFTNFINGYRGGGNDTIGAAMAAIAKGITDTNRIADLVAYIKTLPAHSPEQTLKLKGDIKAGEDKYKLVCGSCHGANAGGIENLSTPKLIGLNDWYIKRQIYNFKNGLRGTHPNDTYGAQMIPMVETLKDEQAINDMICYLQSLQFK